MVTYQFGAITFEIQEAELTKMSQEADKHSVRSLSTHAKLNSRLIIKTILSISQKLTVEEAKNIIDQQVSCKLVNSKCHVVILMEWN
jgi:divalent metal cation (Fe/Co/Zn/Cd) transporter